MVFGLIARSDFPWVDTSATTPGRKSVQPGGSTEDILTPIVLLLLVIVAKLAFSLRRHPALGLHDLLRFIRPGLMALAGVEVL